MALGRADLALRGVTHQDFSSGAINSCRVIDHVVPCTLCVISPCVRVGVTTGTFYDADKQCCPARQNVMSAAISLSTIIL